MEYSLESLGWYFSYDKAGKYPIDTSKPLEVQSGSNSMTIYFTHRPVQQEDGSWVEWFVPISSGEWARYYDRYWGGWYDYVGDPFNAKKIQVLAGYKKQKTYDVNFSNIAVEEFFMAYDNNRDNLFDNWPQSYNKLTDYVDTTNSFYIKFEDFKDKLGGNSTFGNQWVKFKDTPDYVDGVNYESCNLKDNTSTIEGVPYKTTRTIAMLAKLLEEGEEDVVMYKDSYIEVYWNSEDSGVYLKITPMVGELTEHRISQKPVFTGDNIYFVISKGKDSLNYNCNGNTGEIGFGSNIEYLEEYVEQNPNIKVSQSNTGGRTISGNNYCTINISPNKNRSPFFCLDEIKKIFPVSDDIASYIDNPRTNLTSNHYLFDFQLYNPLKITISNITEAFYIGGILNPLRYAGIVKRTYRVKDNEMAHEDKYYVV